MNIPKLLGGKGSSNDDDNSNGNFANVGGRVKHVYDFDPAGLEKAAISARELKDNPHAKHILEQRDKELQNKRAELANEQKAYELKIEQTKMEGVRQQHEYAIEILKEEAKTHRTKAEYEDFLSRERNKDRMKIENQSHSELMKSQEESVKRQEELRRKTIDYELQKKSDYDKQFSESFWRNKAIYDKETKEIGLAKFSLQLKSEKDMRIATFESIQRMAHGSFEYVFGEEFKAIYIALGLSAIIGASYFSKHFAVSGAKKLESIFFVPNLVRGFKPNNSKLKWTDSGLSPAFLDKQGMFYNSKTHQSLIDIINSTKNLRANGGSMRNFLFYGPPGNGKTLFAQKLSEFSGLQYCMISGGDVVPLRERSVHELNKLFDWSNNKKGIVIFLDEADAFLKKRDKAVIGEDMRSALNTFLYRTSSASKNVMLIVATNKPEQLDRAVTDRIDAVIEFPHPDLETRTKLVQKYFESVKNWVELKDNTTIDQLAYIVAIETEGLSAREISKLCTAFEAAALSTTCKAIDKETIISMARDMAAQHKVKQSWDDEDSTATLNKLKEDYKS